MLETLKKRTGLGGTTSSKLKPSKVEHYEKPVAGAMFRRSIPTSEFRRYYERGDLPIIIEH